MSWLPGPHKIEEVVVVPPEITAATYSLDVAIWNENGKIAHVELAIAGKLPDKWYPVSNVKIINISPDRSFHDPTVLLIPRNYLEIDI